MARIRTIKPEFWTSEQIVECSPIARLLFIGLWNFCDDGGIHPDSWKRIKMEVYPGDALTQQQVNGMVNELVSVGLLRRFVVDGKSYLAVSGWQHQKIERPHYRWPQPSESTEFDDQSSNDQRTNTDESLTDHPRNGMDRRGVEGNGPLGARRRNPTLKEVEQHFTKNQIPLDPEEFYNHYASAGWKRGKSQTPITNWKLCIKSWLNRRDQNKKSPPRKAKLLTPEQEKLVTVDTFTTGLLSDGTSIL